MTQDLIYNSGNHAEHARQDVNGLNQAQPDHLDALLARDVRNYPLQESPWFATRTVAMALQTPQQKSLWHQFSHSLHWWIPVPLAGVAALSLLFVQHGMMLHQNSSTQSVTSSESEFEQHMEMIASNDNY